MSLSCLAEAVEKADQSYLALVPGRPAVTSRPVVPVLVVVQVVLAWCPFTQWGQHFVNRTSKNNSLGGEATIFINRPKSIKPNLQPIKPNPNPYPIKPNLNPIKPNLNPIKPNPNPNTLKPNLNPNKPNLNPLNPTLTPTPLNPTKNPKS